METLDTLAKRIATTRDLQSIVRTMKSLSTVSIRQYERAVAALHDYDRTIELGLQVVLREKALPAEETFSPDSPAAAIVFGSDHGLCGRFNQQISRFAQAEMREGNWPAGPWLAVGSQTATRLEAAGQTVDSGFALPGVVSGLTSLANSILLKIDEWRTGQGVARVMLFFNARAGETTALPFAHQLLPFHTGWLERLARVPWRSRALPAHRMPREALFTSLIREHLFVTIFRTVAESMASEHATRLASMQAAERNIKEHLDAMNSAYNQRRQQAITEELLDIVAGFETLRTEETSGEDIA